MTDNKLHGDYTMTNPSDLQSYERAAFQSSTGLTRSQLQAQIQGGQYSNGLTASQLQSHIQSGNWQPATGNFTTTQTGNRVQGQWESAVHHVPQTFHSTTHQTGQVYQQGGQVYHQGGQVYQQGGHVYQQGGAVLSGSQQRTVNGGGKVVAEEFGVESRIEYIPFEQTYREEVEVENAYEVTVPREIVEYEEVVRTESTPVEKYVTDYYAVETQIDYVCKEIVEEVMVERKVEWTDYRIQYIPVEIEIVHYPQSAGGEVVSTRLLENEARIVEQKDLPKGTFQVSRSSAVVGQVLDNGLRQAGYVSNSRAQQQTHYVQGAQGYTDTTRRVSGGAQYNTGEVVYANNKYMTGGNEGQYYTTGTKNVNNLPISSYEVPSGYQSTTTYQNGPTTYQTNASNYQNVPSYQTSSGVNYQGVYSNVVKEAGFEQRR